jgi:hypothetical protein
MRDRKLVVGVALAALLMIPATMGSATHSFSDVATSAFYHDSVAAIANAGITGGCGGSKYCPNSPVTRGQMAVFLNRLGALGNVGGQPTTPVVDALSVNGHFIQGEIEIDPNDPGMTGLVLAGGAKSECETVDAGPNAFNTYSIVYQLFATPGGVNPEEVNVQLRDDSSTPNDETWQVCLYRITAGNLPAGRYQLYFQFTVFIGQGIFGAGVSASDASSRTPARAGR